MYEVLRKKVDILLRNAAQNDQSSNYFKVGAEIPTFSSPNAAVDFDSQEWKLNNRHVLLLIKLHTQLPHDAQVELTFYLTRALFDEDRDIRKVATLTLLHTGNQDRLLDAMITPFTSYTVRRVISMFEGVNEVLACQNHIFTLAHIETLYDWSQRYVDGQSRAGKDCKNFPHLYVDFTDQIREIYLKTNEILLSDFSRQIEAGYNPDINIDEQKVVEAIEYLGLPLDLTQALQHINELVTNANTPHKYRDAMSAIRAFNERLIERIAQEIDPKTAVNGKIQRLPLKHSKSKALYLRM